MSLTESQIIRYSRQILLAQVGGHGQTKLLASGAELVGHGAAQATAAAYLAAGGISVKALGGSPPSPPAVVGFDEAGFLFRHEDAGRPFAVAMDEAVADLNPDARTGRTVGSLGEVPADFLGTAPWVALGWRDGRGEVVYRSEEGCAGCFSATLQGLSPVPAGAHAVIVGTVGALVFQRLCLGAAGALGRVSIQSSGDIEEAAFNRCLHCG
jgi:hypothetical protein